MSMQGSAMMYVTAASCTGEPPRSTPGRAPGRPVVRGGQLVHELRRALDERRLGHDLVEAGRVRRAQARRVGVVREAEDRTSGYASATSSGSIRAMSAITSSGASTLSVGDEVVAGQKRLELASEEQVDPREQDRRHARRCSTPFPARISAVSGMSSNAVWS